MYKITKKITK